MPSGRKAGGGHVSVLVLGSVALDTLETDRGKVVDCLGGSASHAACAVSYFVRPTIVGVVGDDFPKEAWDFLAARADLSELKVLRGKTFRWHGMHDLKTGETVTKATELNTYEQFAPELSQEASRLPYVLLGNIAPELQLRVLEQLQSSRVVLADTMPLWIDADRPGVIEVMRRSHVFMLNAEEARMLTDKRAAEDAGAALLEQGARCVVVKQGGDPAVLVSRRGVRHVASYPDVDLVDPTGAGDNFAGATLGYLAAQGADGDNIDAIAAGMTYGAAIASFAIEEFGTLVHQRLTKEDIEKRRKTAIAT